MGAVGWEDGEEDFTVMVVLNKYLYKVAAVAVYYKQTPVSPITGLCLCVPIKHVF